MKERNSSKGSRKIRISTATGCCAWETYRKSKLNFFRARRHRSGLASRRRRRSRPRLQTQSLPGRVRACVICQSGRKPCWMRSLLALDPTAIASKLPAGLLSPMAAVFQTAAEQNGCYALNLSAIGRCTQKRCLQEVANSTPAWQALPSDYVLEQPKNIVCDRTRHHSVSALDDIFMTSNPFQKK